MTQDDWHFLKTYTPARIAQGRAGYGLPTQALLEFNLDHARARDAVHSGLAIEELMGKIAVLHSETVHLQTEASSRQEYLLRPDKGRKLNAQSAQKLQAFNFLNPNTICFILADGLSALAIHHHALPLLQLLIDGAHQRGWKVAPLCLVEQGRVAVADEIGFRLKAEMTVVLIGERPGLTSPDSLGAYLTYLPQPGLTDERRNCVSNIRSEGLSSEGASAKIMWLLDEMKTRRLSGVDLKDEMPIHLLSQP